MRNHSLAAILALTSAWTMGPAATTSAASHQATGRVFLPALLGSAGFAPAMTAVPQPATALPQPTGAPATSQPPTATSTSVPQTSVPATQTPAPTATKPIEPPGVCPKDSFLDVKADPKNGQYPAPSLSVDCADGLMTVQSNGIPSFEFKKTTPNELQAQNYRWQIPLVPTMIATEAALPLLGPVAIVVDGLPIYGPNEAAPQGYGDPFLDGILDFCDGHTAMRGDYHYHRRPVCLFDGKAGAREKDLVGQVVGYGLDGIPILAPVVCADEECTETKRLKSSWKRTKNVQAAWEAHEYVAGSGDLDRCNGKVDGNGIYHYYATDTFPYFLGCFKGVARQQAGAGGGGGGGGRPPRPPLGGTTAADFIDPEWLYACHVSPSKPSTAVNVPE